MKLRNPFSLETRLLYLYRYDCDICGMNQGLELHHIVGRDSNSPLNASILCHKCHSTITHTNEEERMLYEANRGKLERDGYCVTSNDLEFLSKYKYLNGKSK